MQILKGYLTLEYEDTNIPLKRLQPLTQGHVTFQKRWILNYSATETSNLTQYTPHKKLTFMESSLRNQQLCD